MSSASASKGLDTEPLLDQAGFSKRDRRRSRVMGELTPDEFEALSNQTDGSLGWKKPQDNVRARAARKILRARRAP
jgi:hypothetical protein